MLLMLSTLTLNDIKLSTHFVDIVNEFDEMRRIFEIIIEGKSDPVVGAHFFTFSC